MMDALKHLWTRHKRTKSNEQEAKAVKEDIMKTANETEHSLRKINSILEQSISYRVAKAAGRNL